MMGGLGQEVEDKKEILLDHKFNILFFTDPLCCWSRGIIPHIQQLKSIFEGNISVNYCMCGMIYDWKSYSDPFQSIFKPAQMAPIWMHASEKIKILLDYMIWNEDPPSSSYPACLAVTAARIQSEKISEMMFHRLSMAVTENGRNISNIEIIYDEVDEIARENPKLFDLEKFKNDLNGKTSRIEFKKDMKLAKEFDIQRYPSLKITNVNTDKNTLLVGYHSFESLIDKMYELK